MQFYNKYHLCHEGPGAGVPQKNELPTMLVSLANVDRIIKYTLYISVLYTRSVTDHSTNRLYCDASIVEYSVEDNVDTQKYIFV